MDIQEDLECVCVWGGGGFLNRLLFKLSISLLLLARSNFDHYVRECELGILKKRNKTKNKTKTKQKKQEKIVWELTTEGERLFHRGIYSPGEKSSSGPHCMSSIYNIGRCVMTW